MPKEINHVELLVAPLFPYYQPLRHAYGFDILEFKDFKKFTELWIERINLLRSNPNAILIIARSRYSVEGTYVNPNPRDKRIEALERMLYSFAQKMLGSRLFVIARYGNCKKGRELIDPEKQRIARTYEELLQMAKERGFTISKNSRVWTYGASTKRNPHESWAACPGIETKTFLKAAGIEFNPQKVKIRTALSIPLDTFHRFEKRKPLPERSWARKKLDYGKPQRGTKRRKPRI